MFPSCTNFSTLLERIKYSLLRFSFSKDPIVGWLWEHVDRSP